MITTNRRIQQHGQIKAQHTKNNCLPILQQQPIRKCNRKTKGGISGPKCPLRHCFSSFGLHQHPWRASHQITGPHFPTSQGGACASAFWRARGEAAVGSSDPSLSRKDLRTLLPFLQQPGAEVGGQNPLPTSFPGPVTI